MFFCLFFEGLGFRVFFFKGLGCRVQENTEAFIVVLSGFYSEVLVCETKPKQTARLQRVYGIGFRV